MSDAEAVRLVVALLAGAVLGWLANREVKRTPLAYEDENGYGPVDLRTKLREAERRGYRAGRCAAFFEMAQHRGRHLKIVRDGDDLAEQAESRGKPA